jgi:glycosyltransferase involved in cell wall biosynthesis
MSSPRVTIGLPVYNGAQLLQRSIDSVLGQSFTDLELIIADNGSTDSSVEIAERATADPRVRLLRSPENRGAAWNYNRILPEAKGEYFRWHADDDVMGPTLLAHNVAELDRDPGAVLAYSWTRFIDDDGDLVREFRDDLGLDGDLPHERLRSCIENLTYCNAAFSLIRLERLLKSAQIRPFPGSDVSLLYELACMGRFAVTPEFLFLRRPGNSVKGKSNSQVADWFQPGGPGRRMPSVFIYRTMIARIAVLDLSLEERMRLLGVMHAVWPRQQIRRVKRRRRRSQREAARS